jgi:diguanylate cyclase (GGDEF)-like protein
MTIEPTDDINSLNEAMGAAGDVAYDWDLVSDRIDWAGPVRRLFATEDLSGYLTGETFHGRVNPEDLPSRLKALSDHYIARDTFDCEYRVRQADGGFCWVHDRGQAQFGDGGEPVRMRGVLRLVTRRKQREAQLMQLANFDDLTNHLNRTKLRESLHQAVTHSRRYGIPGAYLTVGIDKLALINSAFGYLTADAVIVAAGQRLARAVRGTDTIGRVGGDTFGIILSHCPEAEMGRVAEKILAVFRDHPIETPSGPIHCTVSIGGVAFPSYVQSSYEAMTRAESAMQEAKRRGRDGFWAYRITEAQRRDHREFMTVGEQVKEALRQGRLQFAYQPVVDAGAHTTEFYECLLRMRGRDGEIVPAGVFVPVIERLGLTREMDRKVLELAVSELRTHPNVRLALNISGFTAVDHGWVRDLVSQVGHDPDVARRLTVEITETAAIQDIEESARFVATVRDLGCRVALDDFGAGFTSFRHLKQLTVDIVKIDGTFVRDIAKSEDNRVFVRTIVDLAHNFGLDTVAECVETAEDAEILAEEHVDCLQGWYFARPSLDRLWLDGDDTAPWPRASTASAAVAAMGGDRVAQTG